MSIKTRKREQRLKSVNYEEAVEAVKCQLQHHDLMNSNSTETIGDEERGFVGLTSAIIELTMPS